MNNFKKKLCIIIACLMLVTITAGCRKNQDVNENEPGEPNTPAAEKLTLSVATIIGETDVKRPAYEAAYRAWESETGHAVSEIYGTANEELTDDIHSSFEDNSEPDVLYYFNGRAADPIVNANRVVPLTEIIAEYPGFAGEHDLRLIPTSTADGIAYAVPLFGHWELMYANKAVLDACGVDLPDENTTWEEFMGICETIKDYGYVPLAAAINDAPDYLFEYTVFNHNGIENHGILPTFAQEEGQDNADNVQDNAQADENNQLDENNENNEANETGETNQNNETNETNLAALNWIAGMDDLRDLYERGFLPANTLTATDAEVFDLLYNNEAAFAINGSWKVSEIELLDDDNITVCFVPGTEIRPSSDIIAGLSSGWYITRKAWDQPETRTAAVSFVQKMISRDTIASYDGVEGMAVTLNGGPIAPENPSALRSESIGVLSAMTGSASPAREMLEEARRGVFRDDMGLAMGGEISSENVVRSSFRGER